MDEQVNAFLTNRFGRNNASNTSKNSRVATSNTTTSQQNSRPAKSSYARPPDVGIVQLRIRNEDNKLSREELARLRREDRCFHCKEVGDHRPPCTKNWRPMSAITTILARVNVSEVAVPHPGHVEEVTGSGKCD